MTWLISLGRWARWRRTAIEHVAGARVLEVGSGTGELLVEMAQRGMTACGLDKSASMQRIAARKLRRRGLAASCVQGDVQALPFQDECLDSIVTTFPAGFILDRTVLSEIYRTLASPRTGALKPGGRLVVVGLCLQSNSRLLRRAMRILYGSPPEGVIQEFALLAGAAGLKVTGMIPGRSEMPVPVSIAEKGITHPTPYPDVNVVLNELLSSVRDVLGNHFLGMYLYGSLAIGDFDPQRSDIDFVVVTPDELPDKMLPALEAMHARMAASGSTWATELEGSYIPQHALRRYNPAHARHPHVDLGGSLVVEQHDSDWVIQRHILRERGVVLAGPDPHTLIEPVPPDELRRAVLAVLRGWWAPMLRDSTRLHSPRYRAYAILTMCRMHYTLQHGTIVTKPAAARWAQAALGERWAALIERALAWPRDAQSDNLSETLDLIRYTLESSQQFEMPMDEG